MSKTEAGAQSFERFLESGQPALDAALQQLAEDVLQSVLPGGFCSVQDWDNRIDCMFRLANGRYVGEMLPLASLSSALIREAGERIRRHINGEGVKLQNEWLPPIPLVSTRK